MNVSPIPVILLALLALSFPGCQKAEELLHSEELLPSEGLHSETQSHAGHEGQEQEHEGEHHAEHKLLVTSPIATDVVSTQRYVCQIHSRRHIEVCALEGGYLEEIHVMEGQSVKQGDVIFKILPVLYQAKLNSDLAEAQLAQIEFNNTQKLFQQNIVSEQEVALAQAKLAKVQAKVQLAKAELGFTDIKAPFDGIIGQQEEQQGSMIEDGDTLTTMSDNSVMWVYFNVPEARYLEYKTALDEDTSGEDLGVELVLANHSKFPQTAKINAIEADFNNETGNIKFRSDFANPKGLLRHGQTGTVLINHMLKDAIVIPQRATFEILAKRYAYVVGDDNVVHQREIEIQIELEDKFVIKEGLQPGEKIILEGIRQVRDGDKVEYEFQNPTEVLSQLKNHAE